MYAQPISLLVKAYRGRLIHRIHLATILAVGVLIEDAISQDSVMTGEERSQLDIKKQTVVINIDIKYMSRVAFLVASCVI